MTEQNSTSLDRLSPSLPTSSYWGGKRDDVLPTQRLNQAVNIALTQCQSHHSKTEGDCNGSEAILTSNNTDGIVPSCDYSSHSASAVLKEEWQRLEQLKEDFLSTVSHELKTPLSSMYLAIQLLELLVLESGEGLSPPAPPSNNSDQSQQDNRRDKPARAERVQPPSLQDHTSWIHQLQEKRAKIQQCLATLSSECKKEIVLINNLISLQESKAGLPSPVPACILLHDWLNDILTPFYDQFKHRHHQFHYDVPSSLSYIITDHIRLEKILQELITNAYKFTPDGGHISLLIEEQENTLMLTVMNKGKTIPYDEIPNLFNIFYRIPHSDPWQTKGTGIGLALAKQWAEAIGGDIRVATGAFGNAFTVYLPRTASALF